MTDITTILNACELIWRQQSVSHQSINDMRTELESHLLEAQMAGKDPESVVGTNIDSFARSWAHAQPLRPGPTNQSQTQTDRKERADRSRTRLYISLAAAAAVTVLGLALGPKSEFDGLQTWQWVFVIATFSMLVGEMLTGGFFVLPFALGAAAATILAFAEVEPPVLILVFLIVSVLGLWGLREFASKDDDEITPVGATRYVDRTAVVTEPIHGIGTVGRVSLASESWIAVSDGQQHIAAGQIVRVDEVRGIRLVVSIA